MGLAKDRELPNGVTVGYHRVVAVTIVTNEQDVVEVASYTSKAKRDEEAAALRQARGGGDYPPTDVFIETRFVEAPYDPSMTVKGAYAYLKSLPEFEGAEDA